jgi:excinuclease ABC subunit C
VLQSFLAQFYDNKPVAAADPAPTTLPEARSLAEALSARRRRARSRSRAEARRENATWSPTRQPTPAKRSAAGWPRPPRSAKLLAGWPKRSNLDAPPRRIEVYDNSHIMGTNAVGAMIVAGPDGLRQEPVPQVQHQVGDLTPGDDFGMMREVLTRRFSRLVKEEGTQTAGGNRDEDDAGLPAVWPGPLLIDGGAGQVNAVDRGILRSWRRGRSMSSASPRASTATPGANDSSSARQAGPSPCRLAIRYFISSSGCATRRTVSPSARTAPAQEGDQSEPARRDRAGSARRASARCWRISVPPRAWRAPRWTIWQKVEGISEAMARKIYAHFHEKA